MNYKTLVITGTAVAFVALAGNMLAIPIPLQNYSRQMVNAYSIASDFQEARTQAFQSSGLGNYFTSPIALQTSRYNSWPWQHASPIIATRAPALLSPSASPAPASIPDDGNTLMLLGGAFSGLIVLRKNLKPVPAARQLTI